MAFDPTKPVQTRNGREARIICTDFKRKEPIVALIEVYQDGGEIMDSYCIDGTHPYKSDDWDLINIKGGKNGV